MSPGQFRRYHAHARARRRDQPSGYRSPTWADGSKALTCKTPDGHTTLILCEGRDEWQTSEANDRVVLIAERYGTPVARLAEGLDAVVEWERHCGVSFLDELGLDILLEA